MSESGDTGAGFVIPELKLKKSYYLGKSHSIFSAELVAILMALNTIIDMPKNFFSLLFCVDSQSALLGLQSFDSRERPEIIYEIKYLIDLLIKRGTSVTFCWVPSHCGLKQNDLADLAAKQGSRNLDSFEIEFSHSLREKYHLIDKKFKHEDKSKVFNNIKGYSRRITSLAFRLFLNAWSTKYCKEIQCTCKEKITIEHIVFHCKDLKDVHQLIKVQRINDIDFNLWLQISEALISKPIEQFL